MARTRLLSFDEELLQVGVQRVPANNFNDMDGKLASSYPGAFAPPRHRPEPPRAPLRKPSMIDWDVPPLALPTGPRKRSFSGSVVSSATTRVDELGMLSGRGSSEDNMEAVLEEEEFALDAFEGAFDALPDAEEDDEGGVFGFADEPDDLDDFSELKLVGLDEDDGGAAAREILGGDAFATGVYSGYGGVEERDVECVGSVPRRIRTGSMSRSFQSPKLSPQVPLGASPLLLSALEGVAFEAGSFPNFQLPEPAGRFRAGSGMGMGM